MNNTTPAFWLDLIERTVSTYLFSFVGLLLLASQQGRVSLATLTAAAWAGVPAGLSVLKAGLAKLTGGGQSASLVHVALNRAYASAVPANSRPVEPAQLRDPLPPHH